MVRYMTLADAPELRGTFASLDTSWPEFMQQDPVADRLYGEMVNLYPQLQGLLLDDDGQPIAKSHAIGFVGPDHVEDLPDRGWEAVLERGVADGRAGRTPTAVSAIEVAVAPRWQGQGRSRLMLERMRASAASLGVARMYAPVRPSGKSQLPLEPMADYMIRVRGDGQLHDPWLRTHARLGATLVKVCPTSMTIPGTLAQWRAWTGLPFDVSGTVVVPGALTPIHVDVDQDHAVYVEPNVWMHHPL